MVDVGWNGGSQNNCALSRLGVGCSALFGIIYIMPNFECICAAQIFSVAISRLFARGSITRVTYFAAKAILMMMTKFM